MHLKSLTLRGFKSFAKPTTFKFEPGITCIVGPNGSGKSNVVDALSWVMGEQGAKNLRGSSMSDVIFAGSADRSGLGRAFVELTIDNADGQLPIEYSEVTISRTLFRGGGSEYAINGTSVRLLDVQELLSDTGMGKQMHVIVGQGQLDAVLRATAEERRAFIDEAAGVLKHRRRKERALRKLESMDQNLVRVLDLIEEIKRQLKPLARQAKAAKAAGGVQAEIDFAHRRLAAEDLVLARERFDRADAEATKLRNELGDVDGRLQSMAGAIRDLQQKIDVQSMEVRSYTELVHQFDSVRERLSSLRSVATERLGVAAPREVTPQAQIELAVNAASEAEQNAAKAGLELAEAQKLAAETEQARRSAEEAERVRGSELQEAEARLALEQRVAAESNRALVTAQTRLAGVKEALKASVHEQKEAQEALESTPEPSDDDGIVDNVLAEEHQSSVLAEQKARVELEEVRELLTSATADLASWKARRATLEPRAMPLGDDGEWKPRGTVDAQLEVEAGWECAIGALLDSFDTAVVVSKGDSIRAGLAQAAKENIQLRAVIEGESLTEVTGDALSHVTFPARLEGALHEFLSAASLVEGIDEGLEVLDKGTVERVATREGVVMSRHTVAGLGNQESPALLARAKWKEAIRQEERAANELGAQTAAVKIAERNLVNASEAVATALKKLRQRDADLAAASKKRAVAEAARSAALARASRADAAVKDNLHAAAVAEAQVREAETNLKDVPDIQAQEYLAAPRAGVARAREDSRIARDAEVAAQLRLRQAEMAEQNARRVSKGTADRVRLLTDQRRAGLAAEELRSKRRDTLSRIRDRAQGGQDSATVLRERAMQVRDKSEAIAKELAQRLGSEQQKIDQARGSHAQVMEQRQQAEVALAQQQMVLDEAEKRGLDLDDDLDELITTYGPHVPIVDETQMDGEEHIPYSRAQMTARLEAAERKLARLGVVNPLAVQEHQALLERHDYLQEQVDDLQSSKTGLLTIIKDVDSKIRTTFESAFSETAKQFEHVFSSLFPNGTGHLTLTDPDDPLRTGVEIYARPAGKRVTQLSLLSGGERSLAALAYLIAIFRACPSPFYVMDEVEAALDDTNLGRVLGALGELRESSQLILITHQKRTMEIAGTLYGVSMRDGTSVAVSHRMSPENPVL